MNPAGDAIAAAALAAGATASWLRWLRVAQREHYLPGSVLRFTWRWWTATPVAAVLSVVAVAATVAAFFIPLLAVVVGLATLVGPPRLGIRGRTSKLAWTRRLRTLAAVSAGLLAILGALAAFTATPVALASVVVLLVPLAVDASSALLAPIELRASRSWVERATRRIERVRPQIVAITGSYGKTSTKQHLADLLAGETAVVPTPRSFNNRAGLARAINDNLADGTRVFIAEMGTYGPGEIRSMCAWCPPDVAVITAIGPVHLERFGTLERTLEAKSEITERARSVVLNVDDQRLAVLADELAGQARDVVRAGSSSPEADVRVEVVEGTWRVTVRGETVAHATQIPGIQAVNLACALAAAVALGFDPVGLAARISKVAPVANRLAVSTAPSGVLIVDDTYNSNPAGAAAALQVLASAPVTGRRVVVTPGMVELGRRQATENEAFAGASALLGATVLVVGRTNAKALEAGVQAHGGTSIGVTDRDSAVQWVRAELGPGDAVLYENDLPDHYP